jgi:hypothetical protein
MICFHCAKEILETDKKHMIGLDVPYINIFFHTSCYNLNVSSNINEYLSNNRQKVSDMVYLESKSKNKGKYR